MTTLTNLNHRPPSPSFSFQTHPGEIFGLLGPNGAGKSSIIRMIMNILTPDSGKDLFDGSPVAEEVMIRIGYLPEERSLYLRQTVDEVLTCLAALKGVPPAQSVKAIRSWLARFDLTDWHDRRIEQLSKGMAQRCCQRHPTVAPQPPGT